MSGQVNRYVKRPHIAGIPVRKDVPTSTSWFLGTIRLRLFSFTSASLRAASRYRPDRSRIASAHSISSTTSTAFWLVTVQSSGPLPSRLALSPKIDSADVRLKFLPQRHANRLIVTPSDRDMTTLVRVVVRNGAAHVCAPAPQRVDGYRLGEAPKLLDFSDPFYGCPY
jgi:hypothetical protein